VVADGFARAAAWARLTAQQPSCRQAGALGEAVKPVSCLLAGWRPGRTAATYYE